MKTIAISLLIVGSLSACAVAPPASPMEKHARLAAGATLAAQQCAGYAGGYAGAQQMRKDADMNLVAAKKLGATPEVLAKAKTDTQTTFDTMAAFTSKQEACNELIGALAWTSA